MYNVLKKAKQQFILASQRAYTRGIQTGNGGNISVRVPEKDLMVIKPSKISLVDCTEENLVVTDFDGKVVEGEHKPSREALLHGELYRNFPEIGGVVHCHSPWTIAWSFTQRDLPLLTLHTKLKLGSPVPVLFFSSPQGVLKEEMSQVLNLFRKNPNTSAFIMGAHGVVAVGPDVMEAEHTAELIEETAQISYLQLIGTKLGVIKD